MMCLILFAYKYHPKHRLVLAANRDEFYSRPTAPLAFRGQSQEVLCGEDLESGGTWLGISRTGRVAALTNFREPALHSAGAPSRGLLVTGCVFSNKPVPLYLEEVMTHARVYNGFNLIAGDNEGLYFFSNRQNRVLELAPGLYGLSNHLLDTPWPKVRSGKQGFAELLAEPNDIKIEGLFSLLHDTSLPPDTMLPDTGVGSAWEKILAPVFIKSPTYGTRSSSIVLIENSGRVRFIERTHAPGGSEAQAATRDVVFSLQQS